MKPVENVSEKEIYDLGADLRKMPYRDVKKEFGYDKIKDIDEAEKQWKGLFDEWKSKGYDKLPTKQANQKWNSEYQDRFNALQEIYMNFAKEQYENKTGPYSYLKK